MPEYVEEEFRKARRALADADRLRDAGGSAEAIVNRLYYACFHGAQAVLYDRGYDPTSHGAVMRLFGRESPKTGTPHPMMADYSTNFATSERKLITGTRR